MKKVILSYKFFRIISIFSLFMALISCQKKVEPEIEKPKKPVEKQDDGYNFNSNSNNNPIVKETSVGDDVIDYTAVKVKNIFRTGVMKFHQGYYSEAAKTFQQALSYEPGNDLYGFWLGNSYYFSGFENAASYEWNKITSKNRNYYLDRLINNLELKRTKITDLEESKFVVSKAIKGVDYSNLSFIDIVKEAVFSEHKSDGSIIKTLIRPVGIEYLRNGSYYVLNFVDGNIYLIDQNGEVEKKINGKVHIEKNKIQANLKNEGFDGPFDLININKKLYITEFVSDEISITNENGIIEKTIGGTGVEDGKFIGPQYIASDNSYIYVTDLGNKRVQKFDLDGNFMMSFGEPNDYFTEGLYKPNGIVYSQNRLFVADDTQDGGYIRVFDTNGNYIESSNRTNSQILSGLEDIGIYDENNLLVTTPYAIYTYDIQYDKLKEIYKTENDYSKLISANFDINGNLLVSDFNSKEVLVLNKLVNQFAGLHIDIERINSEHFPKIQVYFSVSNQIGNPIVGLKENNFRVYEDGSSNPQHSLVYKENDDNSNQIYILLDSSKSALDKDYQNFLIKTLNELKVNFKNTNLYLVPVFKTSSTTFDLSTDDIGGIVTNLIPDEDRDLALSIVNVGNKLNNLMGKKSIIYISDEITANFNVLGYYQALAFLSNHGISFSILSNNISKLDEQLNYMVKMTRGEKEVLYDSVKLANFSNKILEQSSGKYILEYNSSLNPDFGRRYIPIKVETILLNRSGKAESGYFAPITY